MNEVEHDLRQLFERKAGSVGGVAPKLPETVRKRGRRRQLGTALLSGAVAIALVAGSIGVLRALDPAQDRHPTPADDPWTGYEVFERTAVVHAFTITSPSDWYLVDQWRWARPIAADLPEEERVTPVLMLSNTDRGLTSSPCFDPAAAVGADEAVLTIAADDAYWWEHRGQADALPQAPAPYGAGGFERAGPCGAGTYVPFATEDLPFVAHFVFGDDVSIADRQTLIDAFETLSARAVIDTTPIGTRRDHPSGAYVISGGENAAGPWTLELRPSEGSDPRSNVVLEAVHAEGGRVGLGDFFLTDDNAVEQAGGDPVFGAVVKDANAVELHLEDGTPPIPAQLVPLPPSLPFDFDLFFASNDADVQATAVAVGMPGSSPPRPDHRFEELLTVHGRLESALHRLWAELAFIDELEGEIRAAQRDLDTLTNEIGTGGPTEEQADQVATYSRLITRFTKSMSERVAATAEFRARIENLREVRDGLVGEVDPAQFPLSVTVTCTGDGEGGTLVSGPAILAREDGVHINVVNAIQGERVFLDVGTSEAPIEVADGSSAEVVLDRNVPGTLEVSCTYETPPQTWQRPTHPLTVFDVRI